MNGKLTSILSLAVLFVAAAPMKVTAQEAPGVIFHRVCTALPGKAGEAIEVVREFVAYLDRTHGDKDRRVFRALFQPNSQIHFSATYESLADMEATLAALGQDSGGAAIQQKFPSVFDMSSCVISLLSDLTSSSGST